MSIVKVCKGNITTISEKASLQEAVKLMEEKHVCSLFVLKGKEKNQKPIGIITERDINVKILAKKTNLKGMTVAEVMSRDLLILASYQGIKKVHWDYAL